MSLIGLSRRAVCAAPLGLALAPAALARDAEADRIARIEAGLVPRIVLRSRPEPAASLTARMARYRVPGVSLAFFGAEGVRWTRQYGVLERGGDRPVDADTLFQASSIAKTATAMAILRLVREGRLDLDGDVAGRLKGWRLPDTPFTTAEKVTVRRLLSHSAGTTVHGFAGYAPGGMLPTTRQILAGAPPANSPPVTVDTVPGSGWRYSGGGYLILQQLAEETTGE
ncbi:MAG TPA: serine hydrolase domain-containing protein, partial [Caulobacter sp.]|nr:serine hydrolase domain-containing protein [Caulobacter sp.]